MFYNFIKIHYSVNLLFLLLIFRLKGFIKVFKTLLLHFFHIEIWNDVKCPFKD